MTIKEIAHAAQQHLQARTGASFKRTHIYELIAASFGFKSHAALMSDVVLTQQAGFAQDIFPQIPVVRNRCIELGSQSKMADIVAAELTAFLATKKLEAIRFPDLVEQLLQDRFLDEDISPFLLEGLNTASAKNNAYAHYALALIHKNEKEMFEDEMVGGDGSYWYAQEQQGQALVGVQKEWAEGYARQLVRSKAYLHHLQAAGRLGSWQALLDLAEHHGDASFFDERMDESMMDDPTRIAEVATQLSREADAHRWLTVAAKAGNTFAMRQLIEKYDRHNLQQCWTWLYLAELMGADLTESNYHAINEDGSDYDDEVGGPMYADGDDGVHLIPLDKESDFSARQVAQSLFKKMKAILPG